MLIFLIDIGIMIYAVIKGIGWIRRKKTENNIALRTWEEIVAENRDGSLKEIRIWLERKYINMHVKIPMSHQVGEMPLDKRNIYSAILFSESMQDGGIYRFFIGFGRFSVPYITAALNAIGAGKLLSEYRKFTKDMDFSDIELFYKDSCKRKPKLRNAYDYAGFDNYYNNLQNRKYNSVAEKAAFDNSVEKVKREEHSGVIKSGYKNENNENLNQLIWKYIYRTI